MELKELEKLAYKQKPMPELLTQPDQLFFLCMKNLYKLFGLGAISEEEAVTEKKKIVKAYEEAKDNHEMMTVYKSYLEASLKVSDNMREINREIQKTAPDGDRVVLLMADTIERLTNTKFARQGWGNLVWVEEKSKIKDLEESA